MHEVRPHDYELEKSLSFLPGMLLSVLLRTDGAVLYLGDVTSAPFAIQTPSVFPV